MSPEYGATCGFFPVDDDTIKYLRDTNRSEARIQLVAAYAKAQGMFRTKNTPDPMFTEVLKLEFSVRSSRRSPGRSASAGPRCPQGGQGRLRVARWTRNSGKAAEAAKRVPVEGRNHDLGHGDVVIAAITSCTNTSNPSVMIGAGAVRPQARRRRAASSRQAMGQDLAGARLAGGAPEYLDKVEACRRTSTSSASTWSASAAPPASATRARCPRRSRRRSTRTTGGRRRGAVRQSQLRRPRSTPHVRANLPGVAAAGGRSPTRSPAR